MVDFMFAVTHASHWHSINMHQFPGHYPLYARTLGSSFVSRVEDISPGVWFNAFVPMKGVVCFYLQVMFNTLYKLTLYCGQTIKYGVTTVDNLCSDLLNWKTLYLAGRMHKPIRIIKDDARVRLTQQVNLTSAIRTALLTLPESFTETELFERIAGISYAGDIRMVLPGENRGKVNNIVNKQGPQFRELYHRLVVALPGVHWPAHSGTIQQDLAPHTRAAHLRKLPSNLLKRVTEGYSTGEMPSREVDESMYWTKLAGDQKLAETIQRGMFFSGFLLYAELNCCLLEMAGIVRYPSTVQTLKGIVSSGVGKSVRYAGEKVGKWWKGQQKSS